MRRHGCVQELGDRLNGARAIGLAGRCSIAGGKATGEQAVQAGAR